MKLFIVEDDNIQSLILEMMVKKLGLHLIGTESHGEDAVKKILQNKPDVVLLDDMLKDSFNGIDVARNIKQEYDPIIIYITGNSDKAHKSKAKKHGYHDYISKPISLQKLKRSIEAIKVT
jgi:DNA-binding response OmpR family regulator